MGAPPFTFGSARMMCPSHAAQDVGRPDLLASDPLTARAGPTLFSHAYPVSVFPSRGFRACACERIVCVLDAKAAFTSKNSSTSGDSPYMHTFRPRRRSPLCEAARRALLSQGYIASSTRPDSVDGSKNFQPTSDSHAVIEIHVVCANERPPKTTSSTAYVNAVQGSLCAKGRATRRRASD